MATVSRPATSWSGAVLRDVSWDEYESFLDWLGHRPGVKVNYDNGSMEIMAPLYRHDREKSLFGRLIEMLCFVLDIDSTTAGSVTLKKRLAEKGLEPDESYWIAHEREMRGRDILDLSIDPPPDLCLEIEYASSAVKRLPIYAGLGVPEVWRWTDERIEVLLLGEDGRYHRSETSRSFPGLPIDSFASFIRRCYDVEELRLVKEFVAWVRDGMPPLN